MRKFERLDAYNHTYGVHNHTYGIRSFIAPPRFKDAKRFGIQDAALALLIFSYALIVIGFINALVLAVLK